MFGLVTLGVCRLARGALAPRAVTAGEFALGVFVPEEDVPGRVTR